MILLLLGLLSFSPLSNAYYEETDADQHKGKLEMNGIRHSTYRGFDKNWRLVTVRYRKDSGEMRFTYANKLAWKNLLARTKDYSEGAVFAKISVITEDDPRFISSAVPAGAQRIQYMVRNKTKYADTGGWGYALFDADGKTFAEEPKMKSQACAACHLIVADLGHVFLDH